jgi:hypothetical protein
MKKLTLNQKICLQEALNKLDDARRKFKDGEMSTKDVVGFELDVIRLRKSFGVN